MSNTRARVRVPATATPGETVTIRTVIVHPMQSEFMRAPDGAPLERNLIERFTCAFNGETVTEVDLGTGVAVDPFFEFDVTVTESGRFSFTWVETDGTVHREEAEIAVA